MGAELGQRLREPGRDGPSRACPVSPCVLTGAGNNFRVTLSRWWCLEIKFLCIRLHYQQVNKFSLVLCK